MEGLVGKRLRALFAVCALAACLTVVLAGCSGTSNYQPELGEATVSSPTIGEDGTLRVGVNTENSPLAGMSSSNDRIIGIDVDIAAAIADELGLKLSIVDVGSDPEGAIADGKVDIVMGIDDSEAPDGMWLSDEYLPTSVALFALSSSNPGVPTKDSNPKIAAQVSSTSAWAVSNEFGDDALTSTTNLADSFSQLESGSVQYVAADAVIGLYAAHHQGLDVTIVALMSNPSGYCVGVSQSNPTLQTTVSDVVGNLVDNGTIKVIEAKWLGQDVDVSGMQKTAGADANSKDADTSSNANASSSSSAASSAGSSSSSAASSASDDDTEAAA